ncbi:hypothetical protein GA0070614_0407 [Micromonospora coxensis]|uniref:Uncharacterized protein n=1 Tax=Micromonospora coxensis TaxID=356852 RepID=A0A1C5GUW9_9ACTN|nr:hypothetical protein GA0070614_0407 [Micromonospora coxensis]
MPSSVTETRSATFTVHIEVRACASPACHPPPSATAGRYSAAAGEMFQETRAALGHTPPGTPSPRLDSLVNCTRDGPRSRTADAELVGAADPAARTDTCLSAHRAEQHGAVIARIGPDEARGDGRPSHLHAADAGAAGSRNANTTAHHGDAAACTSPSATPGRRHGPTRRTPARVRPAPPERDRGDRPDRPGGGVVPAGRHSGDSLSCRRSWTVGRLPAHDYDATGGDRASGSGSGSSPAGRPARGSRRPSPMRCRRPAGIPTARGRS